AQRRLAARLPASAARVVWLDGELPQAPPAPAQGMPDTGGDLDSLAYVLFTSGSTGRPKGVAMPHRTLSNLIAWQLESWREPGAARTLQFSSPSFDVASQEIFATLAAGGTLVLV